MLRLSLPKEANLVGLAFFLLSGSQTRVDIPRYARHSVHNAPDLQTPLNFHYPADEALQALGFMFYKLPPKDGVVANVGSPLTKT